MKMRIVILLVITICSVAEAWQQICDPVGQPPVWPWLRTGYCCAGYTVSPATIRIELRATPLNGGAPQLIRQFDVNVPALWPPQAYPDQGGDWGWGLLAAIAAQDDYIVAGEIFEYRYWKGDNRSCVCMRVNAVDGYRVALRAISTANEPLQAIPFMPALSPTSTPWPPAPAQLPWDVPTINAGINFDCQFCWTGSLGLVGCHYVAIYPDIGPYTPLSYILNDANEPNYPEDAAYISLIPTDMDVPTTSEWGLIVMAGLLLTAGAVVIVRRTRMVTA